MDARVIELAHGLLRRAEGSVMREFTHDNSGWRGNAHADQTAEFSAAFACDSGDGPAGAVHFSRHVHDVWPRAYSTRLVSDTRNS
jgi:hypothetical protein